MRLLCLVAAVAALLVCDVLVGPAGVSLSSVGSDATARLIVAMRVNRAVVAVLCGAALSVAGLMMQTTFSNPLAGPYVLGVSSGASLGVALVMLAAPYLPEAVALVLHTVGRAGAALLGAGAMLALVALAARRVGEAMTILVLGVLAANALGAVVQILQYVSAGEALKSYVVWSLGSLSQVGGVDLCVLAGLVVAGLALAAGSVKALNLLLLGAPAAGSLGVNVRRAQQVIYLSTTLLAGGVTAYCGPVGFVGLAMPHVARACAATADHRTLLPWAALLGAATMLLCDAVAKMTAVPINALTALVAIPIIAAVVLRKSGGI